MKSKDIQNVVLLKLQEGKSPSEISKDLSNVVSERTVRNWQSMYLKTGKIDLKKPPGLVRTVRTKNVIMKVKKRYERNARQSVHKMALQLGISERSMGRIVKEDLGLRAYHITIEPKLTDAHKQARITFAYWVRRSLTKASIQKILFTDEKYFTVDGIFNRHNDRVYAATRAEADERGGVHQKSKYPAQIMVWLGACYAGVTKPIVFEPFETLTQDKYIDNVLPLALSEGKRLIGDTFIYQQDNARPHAARNSQMWCKQHFPDFIDSKRWPPNSPDLNILDYYVWNAVGQLMRWDKVQNYQSLQQEIKRAIRLVPATEVASSIDSWSRRILQVLKTKGAYIK